MMTHTGSNPIVPAADARQTIAIVAKRPDPHVLQTVLKSSDYDILLIESVHQAYSQIRRMRPQVVIVCLEPGDMAGVQVLSMLHVDSATANIPVVTYFAANAAADANPDDDEDGDEENERPTAIDTSFVHHLLLRSMN
jgi:response regulator RpfG family c-di-GMP phosphodiesterase